MDDSPIEKRLLLHLSISYFVPFIVPHLKSFRIANFNERL